MADPSARGGLQLRENSILILRADIRACTVWNMTNADALQRLSTDEQNALYTALDAMVASIQAASQGWMRSARRHADLFAVSMLVR